MLTCPSDTPLSRRERAVVQPAGQDGLLAGARSWIRPVMLGHSISGPQIFTLRSEGAGVIEALCDSVKSRPDRKYSLWLLRLAKSNDLQ